MPTKKLAEDICLMHVNLNISEILRNSVYVVMLAQNTTEC